MVRHSAMEVTMLRGVEFVERKNTDAFSLSPASVPLCSILSPTAIVLWSDTMKIQKCFMQMIETKQEWFGQHFEVFSWIWGALWLGILNEFVTTRRVTVCKWKDWSLNCIKKSQWFWKVFAHFRRSMVGPIPLLKIWPWKRPKIVPEQITS